VFKWLSFELGTQTHYRRRLQNGRKVSASPRDHPHCHWDHRLVLLVQESSGLKYLLQGRIYAPSISHPSSSHIAAPRQQVWRSWRQHYRDQRLALLHHWLVAAVGQERHNSRSHLRSNYWMWKTAAQLFRVEPQIHAPSPLHSTPACKWNIVFKRAEIYIEPLRRIRADLTETRTDKSSDDGGSESEWFAHLEGGLLFAQRTAQWHRSGNHLLCPQKHSLFRSSQQGGKSAKFMAWWIDYLDSLHWGLDQEVAVQPTWRDVLSGSLFHPSISPNSPGEWQRAECLSICRTQARKWAQTRQSHKPFLRS